MTNAWPASERPGRVRIMTRRVITGLDALGRSAVVIDGKVPYFGAPPGSTRVIWRSAAVPADNAGHEDTAAPYALEMLHDGGTTFAVVVWPAGVQSFWHATDTIDYLTMIRGHITLELETGEVTLGPGEFIVDRGVKHSWRNDGTEPAVASVVTVPALAVGNGRTL